MLYTSMTLRRWHKGSKNSWMPS
ncbi:hypothetical protein E2C01_099815 [Portunus trituberculatus]|uniref:Uncharacterized protein n=1 Tax=Portunus trituberculatus TaxID=210409 RepID=A0A5B7K6H3_PORTR|nr:hypothetical protein [Portunus trituberculatus]